MTEPEMKPELAVITNMMYPTFGRYGTLCVVDSGNKSIFVAEIVKDKKTGDKQQFRITIEKI